MGTIRKMNTPKTTVTQTCAHLHHFGMCAGNGRVKVPIQHAGNEWGCGACGYD